MNAYDFTVKARDGSDVPLSHYRGKTLLIVNTATECGFTPQYRELQDLYEAHRKDGFEILDFPCNQFGEQAPGDDETIHEFCKDRFGITFPQFSKVDVKGEHAIPLFQWLTQNTRFVGFNGQSPMGKALNQMLQKQAASSEPNGCVKWNFTKFLIDGEGEIVARFEPTAPLKYVADWVREAL